MLEWKRNFNFHRNYIFPEEFQNIFFFSLSFSIWIGPVRRATSIAAASRTGECVSGKIVEDALPSNKRKKNWTTFFFFQFQSSFRPENCCRENIFFHPSKKKSKNKRFCENLNKKNRVALKNHDFTATSAESRKPSSVTKFVFLF